jgi:hypothetical protein
LESVCTFIAYRGFESHSLRHPLPRFLRILLRPEATWREIRAADPGAGRILLTHALPLCLLPAVAWPAGRALTGMATGYSAAAAAFVATVLLSLACIALLAAGIYLLAGFFEAVRSWRRSFAVAAYSATPVLLCGALLFVPLLVIASVGGFLFGLGLCGIGLRVMLDCREGQAAGYVAGSGLFLGATSMALGALCSAIGLI